MQNCSNSWESQNKFLFKWNTILINKTFHKLFIHFFYNTFGNQNQLFFYNTTTVISVYLQPQTNIPIVVRYQSGSTDAENWHLIISHKSTLWLLYIRYDYCGIDASVGACLSGWVITSLHQCTSSCTYNLRHYLTSEHPSCSST